VISQQKQLAACTASNNEVGTVHVVAASFYQSDCWRIAIMSESDRKSTIHKSSSPPPWKKTKEEVLF